MTDSAEIVGQGDFRYRPVPQWEKLPDGWSFIEAVGVATDSQDRVFVFNRGEHPVIVFDRDGNFLDSWGESAFTRPHGIWIDDDDVLHLTDDSGHVVRRYTAQGELLATLGTGEPSETGAVDVDYRNITQAGPPFNLPTNLAISPVTECWFVADGYGNARVHKFDPQGQLIMSWGEPGSGPGQFHVPHGIGVDMNGLVFVADRENSRLQVFSDAGEFVEEWTDVVRPCEVFIDRDNIVYVAELGQRAGMFPWMTADPTKTGGRVSIFDREHNLLSRFGGGDDPCSPGDFFAPHDIWVDTNGDIYVGEVTWSAGGKNGLVQADCPSLTKLVRDR